MKFDLTNSITNTSYFCLYRQGYLKIDNDKGRTHELGQSTVKCMRGILYCWMKQSYKIEKFKLSQIPDNTLHTKFTIRNGNEIEDKDLWSFTNRLYFTISTLFGTNDIIRIYKLFTRQMKYRLYKILYFVLNVLIEHLITVFGNVEVNIIITNVNCMRGIFFTVKLPLV